MYCSINWKVDVAITMALTSFNQLNIGSAIAHSIAIMESETNVWHVAPYNVAAVEQIKVIQFSTRYRRTDIIPQ